MRFDRLNLLQRHRRTLAAAFTVTELMVSISILAVIVIALYSVFNQTQRALRSNEAQVDITERGRAVMEMIARELEQSVATRVRGETNMFGGIGYPPWYPTVQTNLDASSGVAIRTNSLHQLFFMTRQTNNWFAIGYKVADATNGVGTLYRYSTNQIGAKPGTNLLSGAFYASIPTQTNSPAYSNYHRIADGVVHFRVAAYDPNGRRMDYGMLTTNIFGKYHLAALNTQGGLRTNFSSLAPDVGTNVVLQQLIPGSFAETRFIAFLNNALPAYVDVELGVLEPETLKQYELLAQDDPTGPRAKNFLAKRINKVHLFRRRVPIPTTVQ